MNRGTERFVWIVVAVVLIILIIMKTCKKKVVPRQPRTERPRIPPRRPI